MGDGRGDFQRVWHEHAGRIFDDKSILDVGSAIGSCKPRLAHGGRNRVTTQDIERSMMLNVDMVRDVRDIEGKWDIVTTFDVVEHAPDARAFLRELRRLAREGVLFTTPAKLLYCQPWHFTPAEIEELAGEVGTIDRWMARYREGERDEILEVSAEVFREDPTIYAHGVYVRCGAP